MHRRITPTSGLTFLLLATSAVTAAAHHSFAMYDSTQLVNIAGTVKEFQWTNPHVILWMTRDAEGGHEPEVWTIELPTSTGNLTRMSWSKRSLVPGDRVTVEINPLRDGRHGGSFKKVTIEATGQVLTASANPPPGDAGTTTGASPSAPPPTPVKATDESAKPAPTPAVPASSKSNSGCATVAIAGRSLPTPVTTAWAVWLLTLLWGWRHERR